MAAEQDNTVSLDRQTSIEFLRTSGGFAVRVPHGQKDPGKGWDPKSNNLEKSNRVLDKLREEVNVNLGIHLFGNLVDVDIDSDDPVLMQALDAFLPPCSHVWGRQSRPRTHRVYQVKEDAFDPSNYSVLRRIKKIAEANVELRGGDQSRGEYTLLPGSVHPSGEVYEWSDLGRARNTIAVADTASLVRAVRLAGAVALLSKIWIEGLRNDLTLALSGFLYRVYQTAETITGEGFRLDQEWSETFLRVLCELSGDDPADIRARVKTLQATWKKGERGANLVGASTIAELTGDQEIVGKLYILLADNPDAQVVDDFLQRFAIWQGPGVVIDLVSAKKGAEKSFMTRQQFANSYGETFIDVGGKRRLLADLIFSMRATTKLAGMTFEPTLGEMITDRDGLKVNQWSGYAIEPWEEPVNDSEIEPVLTYLRSVVCSGDPDIEKWVFSWIAQLFQAPNRKSKTALVLVGKPGAGKSFLGHKLIIPIIGETHAVGTNAAEHIAKSFNVMFDNKIFVQCDEATNNRQKAVALKIDSLITDPRIVIEPKNVDSYSKPNYMRLFFTSNDITDAMYLRGGADDRRYTIIHVNEDFKDAISEFWSPLYEWCDDEDNLRKVHRWFRDYAMDWGIISRPLMTKAKMDMQQRSWEPVDSWLAAMVARGHPLAEDTHLEATDAISDTATTSTDIDRTDWPLYVNFTALVRDYEMHCRRSSIRGYDKLNEQLIGFELKNRGVLQDGKTLRKTCKKWDDRKNNYTTKRVYLRKFPSLKDIADYLEDKFGFVVDYTGDIKDVSGVAEETTKF